MYQLEMAQHYSTIANEEWLQTIANEGCLNNVPMEKQLSTVANAEWLSTNSGK
jgi:hypothetical protein